MDYDLSNGEMLNLGAGIAGDMDVDTTLIDCGSYSDVRGSPEEAEDATFTKAVDERAEAEDASAATPNRKRGRRPRMDLLDLGTADDAIAYELKQGYRILRELMDNSSKSVNGVFMDYPVDEDEDLIYRKKIASPMWLTKMQEKFRNKEYCSITDFVKDFRLMLENCYRFNGPDHPVAKKAQKLEHMLELKLALLSREVRAKTTLEATSGRIAVVSGGAAAESAADESTAKKSLDSESPAGRRIRRAPLVPLPCPSSLGAFAASSSTVLLNRLREEERERERDARRRLQEDRRKEQEQLVQELQQWEQSLVDEQTRREMHAMWELPQIGHFLFLCRGPLNIPEVALQELEWILLMPVESSMLSALMTSLLSTPQQRIRMRNHSSMHFAVWEAKLRTRLDAWYKAADIAAASGCSVDELLGIDSRFFGIVGRQNPLPRMSFADLSYLQKVWILKALCEYCVHTQEVIREAIDLQPADEARETVLGLDAEGRTYLHFPQFRSTDVRVYRLAAVPTRGLDRLPAEKVPIRKKAGCKAVRTACKAPPNVVKTPDLEASGLQVNGLGTGTSCASSRSERRLKRLSAANNDGQTEKLSCTPIRRSVRNRLGQPKMKSISHEDEHSTGGHSSADLPCPPDRMPPVSDDPVRVARLSTACESPVPAGAARLTRRSRRCAAETPTSAGADVNYCELSITNDERLATTKRGGSNCMSPQSTIDFAVAPSANETQECRPAFTSLSEDNNDLQLVSTKHPPSAFQDEGSGKTDDRIAAEDEGLVKSVNDFEAFQLVASSVSELRDLLSMLDVPSSSANVTEPNGTDGAQDASNTDKPPEESRLRTNLLGLLKDLEPFESKLISGRRRVCEKLRREKVTYKPPPPLAADDKVLLEWDADEDEATGKKPPEQQPNSNAASDDGCESKDDPDPLVARVSSKHGADSCEATAQQSPSLVEQESWDVSSFGRLRKRRIIPNNVEDSGMPRKRSSAAPPPAPAGTGASADVSAATADTNHAASIADAQHISDGVKVEVNVDDPVNSEEDCTIISQSVAARPVAHVGRLVVPKAASTAGSAATTAQMGSITASNFGSVNLISIDGKVYVMPTSQVASLLGDSAAAGRSAVAVRGRSSVTDASKNATQTMNNFLRFPTVTSSTSSGALRSAGQSSQTTLLVGASLAGGLQAVGTPATTVRSSAGGTPMSFSRPGTAAGVAAAPASAAPSPPPPVAARPAAAVSPRSGNAVSYQQLVQPAAGGGRLVLSPVTGAGKALGSTTAVTPHLTLGQAFVRPAAPAANQATCTGLTASVSKAVQQQAGAGCAVAVPTSSAQLAHAIAVPAQQIRGDQRLLLTSPPLHSRLQATAGGAQASGISPLNVVQYVPGSTVTQLCLSNAELGQQHGQPATQLFVYQQPQVASSTAVRLPIGGMASSVLHGQTAHHGQLFFVPSPQQQQPQQLLLLNLNGGSALVQQQQPARALPVMLVDDRALISVHQQQQQSTAAAAHSLSSGNTPG